jgi:hypothetical protein
MIYTVQTAGNGKCNILLSVVWKLDLDFWVFINVSYNTGAMIRNYIIGNQFYANTSRQTWLPLFRPSSTAQNLDLHKLRCFFTLLTD